MDDPLTIAGTVLVPLGFGLIPAFLPRSVPLFVRWAAWAGGPRRGRGLCRGPGRRAAALPACRHHLRRCGGIAVAARAAGRNPARGAAGLRPGRARRLASGGCAPRGRSSPVPRPAPAPAARSRRRCAFSSAALRSSIAASRSALQLDRSCCIRPLSFQNKALPIDVMTASTLLPCSTWARRPASCSRRRCSARTTGMASLAPSATRSSSSNNSSARPASARSPSRIMLPSPESAPSRSTTSLVSALRPLRRRVEVEGELGQLMGQDRPIGIAGGGKAGGERRLQPQALGHGRRRSPSARRRGLPAHKRRAPERSAMGLGQLEQADGLAQRPGDGDHRAFDRRRLEQGRDAHRRSRRRPARPRPAARRRTGRWRRPRRRAAPGRP